MEWNNNTSFGSNYLRPFLATRPQSPLAFLFSYNNIDQQNPPLSGLEVKHGHTSMIQSMEKNNRCRANSSETDHFHNYYCGNDIHDKKKKKRLTCYQLESLERSFLEGIKLDPDRKIRLARDLGLQPRQIAVWFQNRKARWKNKELERLYDALKHEYDVVSLENQKLQQEVVKLQALLREHVMKTQVSTPCYNEVSGEETIESAAAVVNRPQPPPSEEITYFQDAEDYYIPLPVQPSYYWQGYSHQLPPYP